MKKIAVIIYGPPGSGKGTQANLLAQRFNLIHFDTGKFLEAVVHDPALTTSGRIGKERKLFDSGKLMTPSFVLSEVSKKVKEIHRAGWGIVFSGSPRTEYEARGLMPVLSRLYSKKRIFIFALRVPPGVSIQRNSKRIVCSVCGAPLLTRYYPSKRASHCPVCAGPFYKRTLDNPRTIKVRLGEYRVRTEPIFDFMKRQGFHIMRIDGSRPPYKVFRDIEKHLRAAKR
ncbi:MAG: nucleoside monophosphate kinase [Candidatus Liptonbacteria bacterium]|nr:nucleoside monophosphate kinase [Candidatus Liptonbacteria bacterium]